MKSNSKGKDLQKEGDIQSSICEYLFDVKHYFGWRQNTTPVYDPTVKVFRRMPKYSLKGVADIILVIESRAVFLEVKRAKTYQSVDQKEFQRLCEENGAEYHVVRSVDDVIDLGF